jgi:peptidoglycan hydrolase-like protein with peptidoglycan-binding domain
MGINPAVVLDDFILNSSELRPFHLPVIDRLARLVAASWKTTRPIRDITLVGHTDISGPSPYNLVLGRRRGLSVRSRLQASLANADRSLPARVRIFVFSAGATRPAVSNATPAGRARNRRVEAWISPPPPVNPNLPNTLRWAQSCLRKVLGAPVAATGRMGPQTRSAVAQFQQRQNMAVSGVLDPLTLNALIRVCGQLRRVPTGPFVTKRSGRTVGAGGDNDQQETRDTMDLLHLLWCIRNDEYDREYPLVAGSPAGSAIRDADIPLTIGAIGRASSQDIAAPVAQHFLGVGAAAPMGAGAPNNKDDVLKLQNVLAGGLSVGGGGAPFETQPLLPESERLAIERERADVRSLTTPRVPDSRIPRTLAALPKLKQAIAGGRLGWSPIHKDENENRGDRFGGRTFEFSISTLCFHPGSTEAVELFGVSMFVPAGIKANVNKVHVFFSPGGVGSPFGDHGLNAVLTHGLRAPSDPTEWILISIPGINENGKNGWRTIDMAAIRSCLDRVGRSSSIDALRLSAHSRGGKGLQVSMAKPGLITGSIDRITLLDCGEFFNGAVVSGFKARGAAVIHYRVNNKNPLAGADVRNLPSGCMRAIGYSRLIDDAREVRPGIVIPPVIASQNLALPDRGRFSSASKPSGGRTSIAAFCSSNGARVATILKKENDPAAGLLEFIQREDLLHGMPRFIPGIYSHHLFVAEIAHELVD